MNQDGTPTGTRSIQSVQGLRRVSAGLLDLHVVQADEVSVVVRGSWWRPRRESFQIALLRPWKPIRLLTNGRQSSYSGQMYFIRDQYLTLCANPIPEDIPTPRLVNLEADLL